MTSPNYTIEHVLGNQDDPKTYIAEYVKATWDYLYFLHGVYSTGTEKAHGKVPKT